MAAAHTAVSSAAQADVSCSAGTAPSPLRGAHAPFGFFPRYQGHALLYIFTCAFLLLFAWLVPAAFFFNNCDLVHYSLPLTLAGLALCAAAAVLLYRAFSMLYRTRFARRDALWMALFFIALLLPQAAVAHAVYYQPGWDVSILTEGGWWLARNKGLVDPVYFTQYPNNIPLLMVWAYLTKALLALGGTDFLFLEIMVCTAGLNAAVWLCWRMAKDACGGAVAGVMAAFCIPFLCFAPWIVIPYSDTATILLPALAFFLWWKAEQKNVSLRRKVLLYALCGAVCGAGYLLKPTVFIVLIGICAVEILLCAGQLLRARRAKARPDAAAGETPAVSVRKTAVSLLLRLGCAVCAAAVLMAAGRALNRRVLYGSGVTEEQIAASQFPVAHWFNMGLSASTSPVSGGTVYGKWCAEDVVTAGSAFTYADKTAVCMAAAREKLRSRGVGGTLTYLSRKVRWFMGDGTMYFNGESPVYDCFVQTDAARVLQNFLWFGGAHYWVTAHLLQSIWLLCIALCAAPLFVRRQAYAGRMLAGLRVCVFGLVLFIALFEGRSRYLTNFLPLFLLLAACGAKLLLDAAGEKRAARRTAARTPAGAAEKTTKTMEDAKA